VELVLGLGLCAVVVGRALVGEPVDALSAAVLVTALLGAGAVGVRRRWAGVAWGMAVVGGIVAMVGDLRASPADVVVGAAIVAVAVARRDARWSWRAPLVLAGLTVGAFVPVDLKEAAAIPLALAAYETARTQTRRAAAVVAIAAAAASLTVGATLISNDAWTGAATPVPLIAATLIGAATGDAVRSRRELEQAWAERTRQGVVEERLRIARDVHDLVAHHLAVMNLHAGVASHHLDTDRDLARQALANVRQAGRTVLQELGTLLSVMRELAPTPTLNDLDQLVAASGLEVDVHRQGRRDLPPVVELTAYRIVQEALTNAHKHGAGRTSLRLDYRPNDLHLEVRNHTAGKTNGQGHGIPGMRERATALGGTLEAGPTGAGEFTLRATIPTVPTVP
jgi:signal transduction histidine kinase